jgi:hypothetical protein
MAALSRPCGLTIFGEFEMGFLFELDFKAEQQRAEECVLAQSGGDASIMDLLRAQHLEGQAFQNAMELRGAGDKEALERATKFLDEATRICQRLLFEWQPMPGRRPQ